MPVGLGIVERWNTKVLSLSADGPSGLGDPDLLVANCVLGVRESLLEEVFALSDIVGHGVLEVWVSVNSDPVACGDNSRVGTINPGSPGINVTNWGLLESGTLDGVSERGDVSRDDGGIDTDTSVCELALGRVTVEILASDGDTNNEVGEVLAVCLDGRVESSDFGLERSVTS